MTVIPIINRDTAELKMLLYEKIQQEHIQRRLVMLIVCIALLLDNMLYMVIVPVIPKYLRDIGAWGAPLPNVNGTNDDDEYEGEGQWNGYLFASKAFVQLMVNPLSGYIIDRHGYEKPMMFGLIIMFFSTSIFAFGSAYGVLFFARSLQGVGSAFADTAGLAMIADRFSDEAERSKMLGIALAFISFGSLVAPPFGGVMYQHMGKESPFIILALVCLADAIGLSLIMKPKENLALKTALQRQKTMDVPREFIGEVPGDVKPTPMWKLFLDPYIAICAGALMMANVSLAFLEPTISLYISDNENMKHISSAQEGLIWLPAFLPHVGGVWLTVHLLATRPKYGWLYAAVGLGLEGVFSFFIPACSNFWVLILPLCMICFGIALIDTALLPALGYLVDVRHVSVYGSVYAIADISYSTAYAFGPVFAGNVYEELGFTALCCMIGVSNLLYVPVLYWLRGAYTYDAIYTEGQAMVPDKDGKMAQVSEWQEQQRFAMSQTGPKNIMRNGAYGSMNRYHREYEKDTDRILPDNDEEDEME